MTTPAQAKSIPTGIARWVQATRRAMRVFYLSSGDRLICAAEDNDAPRVQALLAAGVDASHANQGGEAFAHPDVGTTALHHAVRHGNGQMVQALLDHGASPNAPRAWGETPWWEWLEKIRHLSRVSPSDRTIGLALLRAGARMDIPVSPARPDETIEARLTSGQLSIVEDLQGQLRAASAFSEMDQHTAGVPSTPRPGRRI